MWHSVGAVGFGNWYNDWGSNTGWENSAGQICVQCSGDEMLGCIVSHCGRHGVSCQGEKVCN